MSDDIVEMGRIASGLFDKIVIRLDDDLRGATEEYIVATLKKGIFLTDPQKEVEVIPNEVEAIRHVIETARPGSFIALCTDKIERAFGVVREYQRMDGNAPECETKEVENTAASY